MLLLAQVGGHDHLFLIWQAGMSPFDMFFGGGGGQKDHGQPRDSSPHLALPPAT